MEDFKRKRTKQTQSLDYFDSQLKRTSKNALKTTEIAFEKSTSKADDERILRQRILYIFQTYGIAALAVVNSALWYPLSVKFVKRVFKLKGFLNIHIAIIPIVGHANAVTIGCLQGWFNTYKFRQNYPIDGQNSYKEFL